MSLTLAELIARAERGEGFITGGSRTGAASNFSHIQLWNPAASGKRLYIFRALVVAELAAQIQVRRGTVALTALSATPVNKVLGGGATVAQFRTENNAVTQGSGLYTSRLLAAAETLEALAGVPFVVPEGNGLIVTCTAANSDVSGHFDWLEIVT